MTVTETKQAMGSWELSLSDQTPREVLDRLGYFGHIAVMPGRVNAVEYGDALLSQARYVGVLNRKEGLKLAGVGMAFWLGDEDDKGDVFETDVTLTGATFAASIAALLPPHGAVTAGTINSVAGTYSGTHKYQTPRKALTYVTDVFNAEWRVNGDGTLDAGTVAQLYRTTPRAILVRMGDGEDLLHVGLPGDMSLATDVEDYTTRVYLLAEGEGDAIAIGTADAALVTAKDIHGNTVRLTRVVSESETSGANANARAQIVLDSVSTARTAVSLSSSAYDVKGDVVVGDYLYVYDADLGFVDSANEVYWNGQQINPMALRCVELTWPVRENWTVAFRDVNGVWYDLSDYYQAEGGSTTITVGEFATNPTDIGSQPPADRVGGIDTSIPAAPTFNTPFDSVAYESTNPNDVRAAVYLTWNEPLNIDASTILDGDHYEIRYRANQQFNYPVTWSQIMTKQWNQLNTWGRPLDNLAAQANQWTYINVGWGTEELMIYELMVAAQYEFQIRAVDAATPPNAGAWSASVFFTTKSDVIAPEQPAAPEVAASRIAIQVTHRLGDAGGGTFNLAADLHHLEVHAGGGDFFPTEVTHLGNLIANAGNLIGKIPVVGTFQVDYTEAITVKVIAVDKFGNKSSASVGMSATANLIDSSHISDLTASKITAGVITADLLLAGSIKTASAGQRAELNNMGLQLYDSEGNLTVNLTADDSNPNFIGILDDTGNTVSSMDSMGKVSGQTLEAAEDVIIAGDSFLDDYYEPLPKGIVAYGFDPVQVAAIAGAGANVEKGAYELSFTAEAGRRYDVVCSSAARSTSASDVLTFKLRDGGDAVPTVSSPEIYRYEFPNGSNAARFVNGLLKYTGEFTPGVHRLLWTFYGFAGTMSIERANNGALFTVEDVGSSLIDNTIIINDGGVISATPPNSSATYTKTYKATWSGTYNGSSQLVSYYENEAHQGYYSSEQGNRRSLIGFNYGQIRNDLAGATIKKITFTAYAEHWYNNSGGTAVIGTHSYTSRPGTWSSSRVTENRQQSAGWPKPGKRTVTLSNTIGNEFKSGATTGMALGPGPSTSNIYYGRFAGYDAGNNAPYITITYTK